MTIKHLLSCALVACALAASGLTALFDPNGTSYVPSSQWTRTTVAVGQPLGALPAPPASAASADYFTFDGWYTDYAWAPYYDAGEVSAHAGALVATGTVVTADMVDGNFVNLFGHWVERTFTVTLDPAGGTVSPASLVLYSWSSDSYGELPVPSRTGYEFAGWYSPGGYEVSADGLYDTSDHVLTAHWTAKTVEVTFYPNTGTFVDEPVYGSNGQVAKTGPRTLTWTFDEPWYIDSTGLTPPTYLTYYTNSASGNTSISVEVPYAGYGRVFDGWYTDPVDGTKIGSSDRVSSEGPISLYGHYRSTLVKVTFDPVGGYAYPTTNYVGGSFRYDDAVWTAGAWHPDYAFAGWYTNSAYLGTPVRYDSTVPFEEDFTLYARWTNAVHTIVFDPVGGTMEFDSMGVGTRSHYNYLQNGYVTGTARYMPYPKPDRPGYTLKGWATQRTWSIPDNEYLYDGDIVEWLDNGDFVVGSSYTWSSSTNIHQVWAHWQANTYTVTFDGMGGTPEWASTNVVFGEPYGFLPAAFRDGAVFSGWYTNSSYLGEKVRSGWTNYLYYSGFHDNPTLVSIPSNHSLYAAWFGGEVVVTFNPNGGFVYPTTKTVRYLGQYGELPTPARDWCTFTGWTASDGTLVTATSAVRFQTAHTLRASWTGETYTVTFDGMGGTPEWASTNVVYLGAYGTLPPATRTHFTFGGWYTNSSYLGSAVLSNSVVSLHTNHTLYAKWRGDPVTVTYSAPDGVPSSTDVEVEYLGTYGDPPAVWRTGYLVGGWYTNSAYLGDAVLPSTTVVRPAAHTLYARWTNVVHSVTLDAQGGVVDPYIVGVGTVFGELPVPTRIGYDFAGWYMVQDLLPSTRVSATDPCGGDTMLYADWTPQTYTITVHTEGGTVMGSSGTAYITVTYSSSINAYIGTPYRFGYDFEGIFDATNNYGSLLYAPTGLAEPGYWGPTPDETSAVWEPAVWVSVGDMEAWARWTPRPARFIFDPRPGWLVPNPTNSLGIAWDELGVETNLSLVAANTNPVLVSVTGDLLPARPEDIATGAKARAWFTGWLPTSGLSWSEATNRYEATYSGDVSPIEYTYDPMRLSLPEDAPAGYTTNSPTRIPDAVAAPGYAFDGWYSGAERVTRTPTTAVDLLALSGVWHAVEYRASFAGRGSSSVTSFTWTVDTPGHTMLQVPVSPGWTFRGWESQGGAVTDRVVHASTPSNMTFRALWDFPMVPVTLHASPGTVNVAGHPSTFVTNVVPGVFFDAPSATWSGYAFNGWTNASVRSGTTLLPGEEAAYGADFRETYSPPTIVTNTPGGGWWWDVPPTNWWGNP